MRVQIRDRDALSQLSLVDVRSYLTSQGWHPKGRYGTVATIFVNTDRDGREVEILLPIRAELGDYAARMGDVVETLSEVERRPQLLVFADLIKSGFDVLRFRAVEADDAGTIALEQGVGLYDHARDLMAAAANATVKPRRVYRSRRGVFDQARDYLQQLRLGQTEVGSYVLTVLSPVPPALETEQAALFPELGIAEEPFPRLVTRTLDRALRATKTAVSEAAATGKLDPFEGAIEAGVSGNLCEAVARLAEEGNGVDITISWSRVRPSPGPVAIHSFTQDNARVLSEAASTFRDLEPQTDTTIEGFVVGLHREPEKFDGKAKIRGFVDGEVRTITAEFLHADYQRVLEAHDRKLRVRVDGDLIKRGAFQTLQNARNLDVFEEDDANPTLAVPEP
jgi:hypothetical protein